MTLENFFNIAHKYRMTVETIFKFILPWKITVFILEYYDEMTLFAVPVLNHFIHNRGKYEYKVQIDDFGVHYYTGRHLMNSPEMKMRWSEFVLNDIIN